MFVSGKPIWHNILLACKAGAEPTGMEHLFSRIGPLQLLDQAGKVSHDEHSGLLVLFVHADEKSFMTLIPGPVLE